MYCNMALYIYQHFFVASDQELNCHFVDRLRLLDTLLVPCFAMTGVELWDGKAMELNVFNLFFFSTACFCLQIKLVY